MKPRVICVYKILTVGLAAGVAACTPGSGVTSGPNTLAVVAETAIPSNTSVSSELAASAEPSPAAASPATAPSSVVALPMGATAVNGSVIPRPEPPIDSSDPRVNTLRAELHDLKRDIALLKVSHFRPLCDADGYPLVGNVREKGMSQHLQPSEVCEKIREQGAR